MEKPISAGDLCVVVDGLMGKASPNIGLVVLVKRYVGDEVTFGRIWRCEAEYAERIQPRPNIPMGVTDFAASWLKRLDPPKLKTQTNVVDEVTA